MNLVYKFVPVLLLALCSGLQAQTVWRCSVDGRTVYTDEPCAAGKALPSSDSRTPEQVAEGRRVAQAEAERAQRLVQERQARDRDHGSGLIAIGSGDHDLIKRSTTLAKKQKKSQKARPIHSKAASKHLEEASTASSVVRVSRRTRG